MRSGLGLDPGDFEERVLHRAAAESAITFVLERLFESNRNCANASR